MSKKIYYWHKGEPPRWVRNFWIWLAWRLPKQLVMWAAIRLIAHASTGKWASWNVPDLMAMDALQRWDE